MEVPTWQNGLGSNVCKLESWRINAKDLGLRVHRLAKNTHDTLHPCVLHSASYSCAPFTLAVCSLRQNSISHTPGLAFLLQALHWVPGTCCLTQCWAVVYLYPSCSPLCAAIGCLKFIRWVWFQSTKPSIFKDLTSLRGPVEAPSSSPGEKCQQPLYLRKQRVIGTHSSGFVRENLAKFPLSTLCTFIIFL